MKRKIVAAFAATLLGIGLAVAVSSPASAAVPSGPVTIRPYASGKCLDVTGVSYNNGAYLQLYDCLGGTQYNQVFYLVAVPGYSDRYQIKASHSLRCLDVQDVSQSPGARVQQWDCLGASQTNQVFKFGYLGAGRWSIHAEHSAQAVSFQGLFNGAAVFQWPGIVDWMLV